MIFNCALCPYSVEVDDDYDYRRVGINHEYDAHTWNACQWCGKEYQPWNAFDGSDYCSERCAVAYETNYYDEIIELEDTNE